MQSPVNAGFMREYAVLHFFSSKLFLSSVSLNKQKYYQLSDQGHWITALTKEMEPESLKAGRKMEMVAVLMFFFINSSNTTSLTLAI